MNYVLVSETLATIGHVLVAYMVLMVHYRFWKEHKIDSKVFLVMKREQFMGILGVVLILAGYFLKLLFVI